MKLSVKLKTIDIGEWLVYQGMSLTVAYPAMGSVLTFAAVENHRILWSFVSVFVDKTDGSSLCNPDICLKCPLESALR